MHAVQHVTSWIKLVTFLSLSPSLNPMLVHKKCAMQMHVLCCVLCSEGRLISVPMFIVDWRVCGCDLISDLLLGSEWNENEKRNSEWQSDDNIEYQVSLSTWATMSPLLIDDQIASAAHELQACSSMFHCTSRFSINKLKAPRMHITLVWRRQVFCFAVKRKTYLIPFYL